MKRFRSPMLQPLAACREIRGEIRHRFPKGIDLLTLSNLAEPRQRAFGDLLLVHQDWLTARWRSYDLWLERAPAVIRKNLSLFSREVTRCLQDPEWMAAFRADQRWQADGPPSLEYMSFSSWPECLPYASDPYAVYAAWLAASARRLANHWATPCGPIDTLRTFVPFPFMKNPYWSCSNLSSVFALLGWLWRFHPHQPSWVLGVHAAVVAATDTERLLNQRAEFTTYWSRAAITRWL